MAISAELILNQTLYRKAVSTLESNCDPPGGIYARFLIHVKEGLYHSLEAAPSSSDVQTLLTRTELDGDLGSGKITIVS